MAATRTDLTRKGGSRNQKLQHLGGVLIAAAGLFCLPLPVAAQEVPESAVPKTAPRYFPPTLRAALGAPLPAVIGNESLPGVIPAKGSDRNPSGVAGFISDEGVARTIGAKEHPFFKSLGANGRSCGTCHQPSQAMSVSVADIKTRFRRFGVRDPIFAPVDGANCPTLVPASETRPSRFYGGRRGRGSNSDSARARSLLLNFGLFRIFMPVRTAADFTIKVTHDPYGCNTPGNPHASASDGNDGANGTGGSVPIFSMYRRPLMSANLAFKTETLGGGPSGNIMWDGREPNLFSQALNATLGHAQRDNRPTSEGGQGSLTVDSAEIRKIVAYEVGFFTAQQVDNRARALDDGAKGGVVHLRENMIPASKVVPPPPPTPSRPFDEFDAWSTPNGARFALAQRLSIQRGQALFNGTAPDRRGRFAARDVPGFSDVVPPFIAADATCANCHSILHGGSNSFPASQSNIGVSGDFQGRGGARLRKDLPIFTITCESKPAFHPSNVIETNDPGRAMISGRCADIGKSSVPSLRNLASRAPFFRDGSARTLADVVDFYNQRFGIGLTRQEKTDLTNFLAAL